MRNAGPGESWRERLGARHLGVSAASRCSNDKLPEGKRTFAAECRSLCNLVPPLKAQAANVKYEIVASSCEFNEIFNDWTNTGGRGKNASKEQREPYNGRTKRS